MWKIRSEPDGASLNFKLILPWYLVRSSVLLEVCRDTSRCRASSRRRIRRRESGVRRSAVLGRGLHVLSRNGRHSVEITFRCYGT